MYGIQTELPIADNIPMHSALSVVMIGVLVWLSFSAVAFVNFCGILVFRMVYKGLVIVWLFFNPGTICCSCRKGEKRFINKPFEIQMCLNFSSAADCCRMPSVIDISHLHDRSVLSTEDSSYLGVLHPWPILWLFMHVPKNYFTLVTCKISFL